MYASEMFNEKEIQVWESKSEVDKAWLPKLTLWHSTKARGSSKLNGKLDLVGLKDPTASTAAAGSVS